MCLSKVEILEKGLVILVKHFQINIVLFFWMAVCVDTGIMQAFKRRNLSSLINSGRPSTTISPVVTQKPAPVVTKTAVVTKKTSRRKILAPPVLVVSQPVHGNVHTKNDEALLNSFAAQQTNPDRLAALKILNDVRLSRAYRQDLMSIDLLFLELSTKVLQKYSVQASTKHGKRNLGSLVSVIAPSPTSGSGIKHLSDLISLIQAHTTVASVGGIQKRHIVLSNLIKDVPVAGTVAKKAKNDLLGLISSQPVTQGSISYRRKRNLSGLGE